MATDAHGRVYNQVCRWQEEREKNSDTCLTAVSEGKIEEFAFKDRLTFLTTELNMHF